MNFLESLHGMFEEGAVQIGSGSKFGKTAREGVKERGVGKGQKGRRAPAYQPASLPLKLL